jgi:hypothetical protein
MMTVLLRGVAALEEDSLLGAELEDRTSEVAGAFYQLIHEVVTQAEALSRQLAATGHLHTFHEFVTKVRHISMRGLVPSEVPKT